MPKPCSLGWCWSSPRTSGPGIGLVVLVSLLAACSDAEVTTPSPTTVAPIRTSSETYVLVEDAGGLATDIAIRFANTTSEALYIVNCNGTLAPLLEKQTGSGWQPFLRPVVPTCLSPPIVIESGESLERTLRIWGAVPPANAAPLFESADVEGTYRIVLESVVSDYDPDRPGFGDAVPVEDRVSNPFELER